MKLLSLLLYRRSPFQIIQIKNALPVKSNFKCLFSKRSKNISPFISKLPFFSIAIIHAKPMKHEKRINIFEEARLLEASKSGFVNKLRYFFWNIWDISQTFIRTVCLAFYFTPLLLLWPVTLISTDLKISWYNLLVAVLEFSGPIFIKLGQWASMRRDLFTEELCVSLATLQRHTKPHSWYYTRNSLRIAYGPNWAKLFLGFNPNPIGSGCCAQVYQAWLNPEFSSIIKTNCKGSQSIDSWWLDFLEISGVASLIDFFHPYQTYTHQDYPNAIPVAIKVRHPRVDTLLRRDLIILHAAASSVSFAIPSTRWLSFPECVDEFANIMSSQINLLIESNNLERFASNFVKVKYVKFPKPITHLGRPFILIETFEEGDCVNEFIAKGRFNKEIANLGISTIFKMVFIDSFAHGDLHPGNILVQENNNNGNNINLVFLDCGIVARLDFESLRALRGVFRAIALGDGDGVAQLFLDHSEHMCKDEALFKAHMRALVSKALVRTVDHQKDISGLLASLFSALIEHKVRLDAAFSSVILSLMVLEGLSRTLDPEIDLVERARPFLIGL